MLIPLTEDGIDPGLDIPPMYVTGYNRFLGA